MRPLKQQSKKKDNMEDPRIELALPLLNLIEKGHEAFVECILWGPVWFALLIILISAALRVILRSGKDEEQRRASAAIRSLEVVMALSFVYMVAKSAFNFMAMNQLKPLTIIDLVSKLI